MGYAETLGGANGAMGPKGDKGDKGDIGTIGWVSVLDFGAIGDGVSDDTSAIQSAIDHASARKLTVIFPTPSVHYLIKSVITLKTNTNIVGFNSKIFMASRTAPQESYMFGTDSSVYTDNITITGMILASLNNRAGAAGSYFQGSTVSNVFGIAIRGATNVTIRDCVMTDLLGGIMVIPNSQPSNLSKTLYIQNVQIYNTMTPILTKNARDIFASDCVLDATGSTNAHLHCWYIDTDCQNIYANNIKCMNSSGGGGIQIYSEESIPLKNAVFNNITVENCKTGMFIYRGASSVAVNNLNVKGCKNIINVNDCNGVTITGGKAEGTTQQLFYLENAKNLKISGMVVDAAGAGAYSHVNLLGAQQNVTFDNITFTNLPGNKYFVAADDPLVAVTNLIFQNCTFDFSTPDPDNVMPFYFANAGSDATIQGCRFAVSVGVNYYYLIFAAVGTKITARNNTFIKFNKVANSTTTVVYNNILDGKPSKTSGATSIADGGTIVHGLPAAPVSVRVNGSVAAQILTVTAKSATTFTVAIKTTAGAAGTTQTVYWEADYNL